MVVNSFNSYLKERFGRKLYKISLDAGYRYTDYGNVKESVSQKVPGLDAPLNVGGKYDVTSHEFLLGARYSF